MKWPLWSIPKVQPVEYYTTPGPGELSDITIIEPIPKVEPSVDDPDVIKGIWVEDYHEPVLAPPFLRKEEPKMSLLRYDVTVTFLADPADLAVTAATIEELRKVGTLKIKTTNVRAPKSAE